MLRSVIGAVAATLLPAVARAHDGSPIAPHDLPFAWSADPWILIALGTSALLYSTGLARLWATRRGRGIRRWEARCFWSGWVLLLIALVSPLHAMAEALFSAHMAQHVLLMAAAAPLLVLGRPLVPWLWALPIGWRRALGAATRGPIRRLWRGVSTPAAAWSLHAAAIWLWHVPLFYEATLAHRGVHTLQHLSFLGTALLFWWVLVRARGGARAYGISVFSLFTTALHGGALGALLTFARRPWYEAYQETVGPWGLTPLEDQQLAGLIMWVPAGLAYLIGGLVLLAKWMGESERGTARWEERTVRVT